MTPTVVAAVQMVSTPRVDDNLVRMADWVAQAASRGAELVLLPEYFCLMGAEQDKVRHREPFGVSVQSPIQKALSEVAARHGVWLVGGTVPLVADTPDRVRNTVLVFDPQGNVSARYDKIHLFAFQKGQESYDEAKTIEPGNQPVVCETVAGPCRKPLDRAWMVSAEKYTGPGGQEFFSNPGGVWMVHHGFLPGQAGRPDAQRRLYLDLLKYSEGDPVPRRVGAQYTEWSLFKTAFWLLVVLGAGVGGFVWFRRRRRRASGRPGGPA